MIRTGSQQGGVADDVVVVVVGVAGLVISCINEQIERIAKVDLTTTFQ